VDFALLAELVKEKKMNWQDALILLIKERALLVNEINPLSLTANSQGTLP